MAFNRFNHLQVPEYWEKYFTKYPQGMTILESLFQWVKQVDDMTDNVNNWNDYLDIFVSKFDKELQITVTEILTEWQKSGLLDDIIDEALQTQMDEIEEKMVININDFPLLEGETTDDLRFSRALSFMGKGTLNLNAEEYRLQNEIVLSEYQNLKGVRGATVITRLKEDGNTKAIIKVKETGGSVYWVGISDVTLQYYGFKPDIVAIDYSMLTHGIFENILIKGYLNKAITGVQAWLCEWRNITAWCDNDYGYLAFEIPEGTSNGFYRVWSKNFARGFNFGNTHYSHLSACACDSFSVFAYYGGQSIVYNGCGAESAKLVAGGFVFGGRPRTVTINGGECLSIGSVALAGETSLFYFDGTSATISGFRLESFAQSSLIDTVKTTLDAKVNIENSRLPSNYRQITNIDNDYAQVVITSGANKKHYFKDETNNFETGLSEFEGGWRKGSTREVISSSNTKSFISSNKLTKNSFSTKTSQTILTVTHPTISGKYTIGITYKIIATKIDGGLSVKEGTASIRNGSGGEKTATLINTSGLDYNITMAWNGESLECIVGEEYTTALIDVTVVQNVSSAQAILNWG